jgi:hypothetical protein
MGASAGGGGKRQTTNDLAPFIRAIVVTFPWRKFNRTSLHKSASASKHGSSQGSRSAAHSCRSDGICAMPPGSVPLNLFSAANLPQRRKCGADDGANRPIDR